MDTAGPAAAGLLRGAGAEVVATAVLPDDRDRIAAQLRRWADEDALDLIVTTGGTGLSPRDVTPEATLDVADREVPGLAELMRSEGRKSTPMAALSRAVAASRGRTLILNLPGSERGARESLETVMGLVPHAIELLRGEPVERHPSGDD
ncbi:MAG TPA: MogA/MoaB family molybdenum cofactor biosynthesis protein [Dehalococcoidia bacterium]|nr:MogA/MoaB family molybdenum cofactor biosynthesis protein [Dehalococcoidia bacterium]